MEQIYSMLGISAEVEAFGNAVLKDLKERFEKIDAVAEYNQAKVLRAMQEERVDGTCFAGSTGYGYNDNGRDKLEKVYALGLRRLWCAPRLPAAHMHWQSR